MWYQYAQMDKREWLAALKRNFQNPFYVFDERVTGFVLGPFFAVAHYQPWEWNRRITAECNRAWGFVKEVDGELEISFLRSRGFLSPFWLLFYTLVCELIFLCTFSDYAYISLKGMDWAFSVFCSLLACGLSAVQDSMTERGQSGAYEIDKLLKNPKEY